MSPSFPLKKRKKKRNFKRGGYLRWPCGRWPPGPGPAWWGSGCQRFLGRCLWWAPCSAQTEPCPWCGQRLRWPAAQVEKLSTVTIWLKKKQRKRKIILYFTWKILCIFYELFCLDHLTELSCHQSQLRLFAPRHNRFFSLVGVSFKKQQRDASAFSIRWVTHAPAKQQSGKTLTWSSIGCRARRLFCAPDSIWRLPSAPRRCPGSARRRSDWPAPPRWTARKSSHNPDWPELQQDMQEDNSFMLTITRTKENITLSITSADNIGSSALRNIKSM